MPDEKLQASCSIICYLVCCCEHRGLIREMSIAQALGLLPWSAELVSTTAVTQFSQVSCSQAVGEFISYSIGYTEAECSTGDHRCLHRRSPNWENGKRRIVFQYIIKISSPACMIY